MRKFLLLLTAVTAVTSASAAEPQDVRLYGQLYTASDYSIYSFSSGATDGSMEKVAEIAAEPNCGSVKTADRFYCFSQEPGDYGTEYRVYVYDATDNYRLVTAIGSAYSIAKQNQVLAYDPTTGKIFSVYKESSYYGTEYYLGEVNLSSRTMEKIGSSLYFGYGSTSIVAMAFNPDGELYAIASNAYLYKIDKTNANLTNVGYIGIYPQYVQSMTFSPDGTTIYWAACNDDMEALYGINPADGSSWKIKDFTNGEEFASLWAGDIEAADGAPAAPTGLRAEFVDGSLSGKIMFTAPVTTHAGDDLTGEIRYEISSDGETVGSGTVLPGEEASCDISVATSGTYEFKVTLFNDEGQGDSASLPAMYVGIDVPVYVENLAMTREEDSRFVITWDAPTEGAHGGYIDASAIKYRIRRLPSFDILSEDATSPFVDTFDSETPVKCSYEVTPYIDENTKGLPLTTPFVMVGKPFDTPYESDFATTDGANLWTVIDSNNDGHSWEYQWDFGYYRIYDNENPKDDWLISPYIKLSAGYSYRLTYKVRTIATEEMEVRMGTGLSAEAMTCELVAREVIPDTDYDWVDRQCDFDCTDSGNYHFGFHAMTSSPDNALALYVKDVKLEQTGSSAVKDVLTETAGADFTVEGRMLTALSATLIEVATLDGRLAARAALLPGQSIELPAGLYIITSDGGQTAKAIIR